MHILDRIIHVIKFSIHSILSLVILISLSIVSGCQDQNIPATITVSSTALLIDTKPFPKWTDAYPCGERDCGVGFASRTFHVYGGSGSGHAFQEVYRFRSAREAQAKFQLYRDMEFHKATTRTPSTDYVAPTDIAYASTLADESYLACGVDITPQCKLIVRYRNVFIFFFFDVNDGESDGLTHTEIELIVNSLDKYIAPYLTATPTP